MGGGDSEPAGPLHHARAGAGDQPQCGARDSVQEDKVSAVPSVT